MIRRVSMAYLWLWNWSWIFFMGCSTYTYTRNRDSSLPGGNGWWKLILCFPSLILASPAWFFVSTVWTRFFWVPETRCLVFRKWFVHQLTESWNSLVINHRIHVCIFTYIFIYMHLLYIDHRNQPHVGKYTSPMDPIQYIFINHEI